jgi:hypothetical protein
MPRQPRRLKKKGEYNYCVMNNQSLLHMYSDNCRPNSECERLVSQISSERQGTARRLKKKNQRWSQHDLDEHPEWLEAL